MSQSAAELTARLNALHDSLKQTLQLIQRLAKLQHDTTTADAANDIHEDDTPADLAAEIHESLKQQENDLDLLKLEVEDAIVPAPATAAGRRRSRSSVGGGAGGPDEVGFAARCVRLEEDLTLARTRFRKAQLQAKHNATMASQNERAAYLASLKAAAESMAQQAAAQGLSDADAVRPGLSHADMRNALFTARRGPSRTGTPNNATKEDMLLTSASDLTTSLRRTHALLSSSLSQSQFAHDTLESSNAALKELNTRYGALDDLLSKSRGLLGTLLRSTKSDTWYLTTSVWVLVGTIGWLLFRRLLYGPMWWFVWLPIKLGFYIMNWMVGGVFGLVIGDGTFKSADAGSGVGKYAPQMVEMQGIVNSSTTLYSSSVNMVPAQATPRGVRQEAGSDDEMSNLLDRIVASTPRNTDEGEGSDDNMSNLVARIVEASQAMDDFAATFTDAVVPTATEGAEQAAGHEDGQAPEQAGGQHQHPQQDTQEPIRRADGTVLRDRDEATEPRNPKKRMWEEPPAAGRQQQPQQQREL